MFSRFRLKKKRRKSKRVVNKKGTRKAIFYDTDEKQVIEGNANSNSIDNIPFANLEIRPHSQAPSDCIKKLILVGDSGVGKSSILLTLQNKAFPSQVVPMLSHNFNIIVEGNKCEFAIHDIAGGDEYAKLRRCIYSNTDIVLLCFAVDDHKSLMNVKKKWHSEKVKFCPDAVVVLVGTKSDLRMSNNENCISSQKVKRAQLKVQAASYVECSAKYMVNLDYLMEEVARVLTCKNSKEKCHIS